MYPQVPTCVGIIDPIIQDCLLILVLLGRSCRYLLGFARWQYLKWALNMSLFKSIEAYLHHPLHPSLKHTYALASVKPDRGHRKENWLQHDCNQS